MTPRALAPLAFAAALAAGPGCKHTGHVEPGVWRDEYASYRVGLPGPGWEVLTIEQGELAYYRAATGSTLEANSTCRSSLEIDAPLRALAQHLVMNLTARETIAEEVVPFANREAYHATVSGRLDGVPVVVEFYVLRKDRCVFDLVFTSFPEPDDGRDDGGADRAAFERFVAGFRTLEPAPR